MRSCRMALLPLTLAACSGPLVEAPMRLAALEVVRPIAAAGLPPVQADLTAHCIVDNASTAEVQALAQDLGASGGTRAPALIARIVARPEVQACLIDANLPQPRV